MEIETKILLIGVIAGAMFLFYREYILPLLAQNALKQKYQSAHEPQIILQSCEMDSDFWAKVQMERARYEQSGNAWALEQNPVIPYPMNREFSFKWFDETISVSTVGLGQREYLAAAIRQYDACLKIWQTKTGKEFGYDATFQAAGQKPFHGNVWSTGNIKTSAN